MHDIHRLRATAFNRFYVALMFAVICAIGACGVYALIASQRSADLAATGDDRTSEARRMTVALDREQQELLLQTVADGHARAERFGAADRTFDDALRDFERDATPDELPFVRELVGQHGAYAASARAIVAAFAQGDLRRARVIERWHARPKLLTLRNVLDVVSSALFVANERDDARVRAGTLRLEKIIAMVTTFALLLMSGFAALLARYRRSAVTAADARLVELERATLTDNLTHLGNHRAFSDDFARELARAKRNDHALALVLLDVDDFKAVNDTRGHAHGDAVLTGVGDVLRTLRPEDRAYRVGGDEFAVLLVETGAAAAEAVVARLQRAAQPALLGATLSIGYVNLEGEQLDLEPYELADSALYEAKRRGRNTTVCFDDISESVHVFSPRKAEIVRRMIAEEHLSVAFQPIWDIDSTRPLAFEALARPAPDLDISGPQEAFDIAERIRQVYELDELCIRQALEAVTNLPKGSTIFLNVSPATLAHARFVPSAFVAQVRSAGVDPNNVVIELTERRIDDQAGVIKSARALQALGVRMALDDTGSGHAGLEILSKLRLDFVKIDRTLLVKALDDKGARGVLAGIIAIARETGSYLIAEGIESRQLLDFACKAHDPGNVPTAGIRGVQGYLLGRPQLGHLDLFALERHHAYLVQRELELEGVRAGTLLRHDPAGARLRGGLVTSARSGVTGAL